MTDVERWQIQQARHRRDERDLRRGAQPGCGYWPCDYRIQAELELAGRHMPGKVLALV